MAEAVAVKLYNNFTRGLITEAEALTYPDNSCQDMDNVIVYRKGDIQRRYGLDLEAGSSLSSYTFTQTQIQTWAFHEFKWESVALVSGLNFLVLQTGSTLHFYDLSFVPLSGGVKSFTVDLTQYIAPGFTAAQVATVECSFCFGRGSLFCGNMFIDPIQVIYAPGTDTILVSRIIIQVRDLVGVDDGLAPNEQPTTLSNLHKYNLQNQGWNAPDTVGSTTTGIYWTSDSSGQVVQRTQPVAQPGQIQNYFNVDHHYPGNNKQWWLGKNASGGFDPNLLDDIAWGDNLAPRGYFVLNAFYKDRSAVSGIPNISVEVINQRPSSLAFYGGRVWYLCADTVYYSQVLDSKNSNVGACYQAGDPTSENLFDLVATDGGQLPIHEMGIGLRLLPAAWGMLIFATQGVWYLSESPSSAFVPKQGFTATDFGLLNISLVGSDSPYSAVSTQAGIYWFSKVGIQMIDPGNIALTGGASKSNISQNTIQTYFNTNFNNAILFNVNSIFDPAANVVQWLFQDSSITAGPSLYNKILNFDLTLNAFYPFSVDVSTNCFITGVFSTPQVSSAVIDQNVTSQGTNVTSQSLQVTSGTVTLEVRTRTLKYTVLIPNAGMTAWSVGFATFTNTNYADWFSVDNIGRAYLSKILTGYELLQDAIRDKRAPWLFCYFQKTETGYVQVLNTQDWVRVNPSSCTMQAKWDWSDTATSNRWSAPIEVYRLWRLPPLQNTTFDNGYSVVWTRNRLQGNGKTLQLYFSNSTIGTTFDLLGWSIQYNAVTSP